MSETTTPDGSSDDNQEATVALDAESSVRPDTGDDERDSKEQIARTGEPPRDALGNGDGAS